MKPTGLFALATLLVPPVLGGAAEIVNQTEIGNQACGPCAIVNSYLAAGAKKPLRNLKGKTGLEKVRSLIDEYASTASAYYAAPRTAYTPKGGAADRDLAAIAKRFATDNGLPAPAGQYVVRQQGESHAEFLDRIQGQLANSIANGFHPLLSVRAIAAEFNKEEQRYQWNSKGGHWIAVHSVGSTGNQSLGFSLEFSDSISGKLHSGVAYSEQARGAGVPLSFTVDESGNEQWKWVRNSETLTLFSPGMPLGTRRAKWNERAFIAIRYVIFLADDAQPPTARRAQRPTATRRTR